MYCARRPLACYVHDTRFAWAVRVAYFCWGQRRPECVVSQCGNPRFLWLSITITPEIPPCSTVFASRVVSPAVEEQALRWAEACCATDRVVISGFQSPLEKSVFELLLKARHPVIWALGRTLYHRYSPEIQAALTEQRILIFAVRNTCRTNWQTAQTRNYLIASMSDESVYAMNIDGRSSSLKVLYEIEKNEKNVYSL